MTHFVYRLTSPDGELLYVGQTNDVDRRVREHCTFASWARGAVVTHEALPTRAAALRREREVIEQEHPVHNVRWNGLPTPELVTLSVRVTRSMADRLKTIADGQHRSMAAEIRRLIQERIDVADLERVDTDLPRADGVGGAGGREPLASPTESEAA